MSSSVDRLARNLAQLASRLRAASTDDDGALRRHYGTTLTELRILRDRAASQLAPHDRRRTDLVRVDAALAELAAAIATLPRAALVIDISRPVQRRRAQRAARLDADTARLLKRATIVLGLGGAAALPLAAAAGSCTVGTTQTCTGDFSTGLDITGGALTAFVQSLTANIAPPSGIIGIKFDSFGSEGSHDGAGDSGDQGGPGPNTTLTVSPTTRTITTSGDNAIGVALRSFGGGGGNGGDGVVCPIPCISAGNGGGGGNGGNVNLNSAIFVTTTGDYATGVLALSKGGQGGSGGDSNGGPSAGTGGPGGDAGTVTLTNAGAVRTSGKQAHGVYGASIGGNGGSGGGGFAWAGGEDGGVANKGNTVTIVNDVGGDIVTTGVNAVGIYGESIGGFGGGGGDSYGIYGYGGSGSLGGDAGSVSVTNHASVSTSNTEAYAIFAQSVGGGGGNGGDGAGIVGLGAGGDIGGKGMDATVINTGRLTTLGEGARGIFAQSIGGGGGNGGSGAGIGGVGGSGSGTSPGGNVSVTNSGDISTRGQYAYAIEAQSVGGGGGDGGMSIGLISIGGSGGAGGDAGTVGVGNTGSLSTIGADASAIFAQSVGGGGGNGGNSVAVGAFVSLALGGKAGPGGVGKAVTVTSNTGTITTAGDRSSGIFAQSVGGGGGNGGFAISASAGKAFSVSVGVGGQGSDGGKGDIVTVNNGSNVNTAGEGAYGVFAQSIGGGGGNGGMAIAASGSDGVSGSFAVGGHAGGGGNGDKVTLTNTGIINTGGDRAGGVVAQSIGGGGGNGGLAIAGAIGLSGGLSFAVGGDGGGGGISEFVSLTNSGAVTTGGDFANGVLAQSVGGGGGNGGGAIAGSFSQSIALNIGVGGKGNTGGAAKGVLLVNDGAVATGGDNALGVVAQSIGGGGGNGGFAVTGSLSQGYAAGVSVGGSGDGGGDAADATLRGGGSVITTGFKAIGMMAQSVGGGGGNGGFSIAGSIAQSGAGTFSIGGSAAQGGKGGKVVVDTTADITTRGDLAYGLLAQSLGGGGGTGGFAISGTASGGNTIAGVSLALGGKGGSGRDADTVDLTSGGDILTYGAGAHGVIGQSIGGGGGDGGFAGSFVAAIGDGASANFGVGGNGAGGGSGKVVHVTTSGTISTFGQGAYGVLAQSVGGGGGDGGWGMAITGSAAQQSKGTLVGAIGGNGGAGGLGEAVFLANSATVTTLGSDSYGLLAQSIGGGGGNGGFSASGAFTTGQKSKTLSISVGGQGGSGNDAGVVTLINSGKVSTTGNTVNLANTGADADLSKTNAIGILAQSIGGGGGNGGAAFSGTIGGPEAKSLALTIGGFGGAGGTGGAVSVTNNPGGDIETDGAFGYGIEAQSVGGGGGNGGMAVSAIFGASGEGTNANVGITLGGQGGDGNFAGTVGVDNKAGITTHGAQSAAILAQSLGGGGGAGGLAVQAIMGVSSVNPDQAKSRTVNVAVAVGGLGGDGSNGGAVTTINSGALTTWGNGAQGILAQSIGGGGGVGGSANTISLIVGAKCSLNICKPKTDPNADKPDNADRNVNLQAAVGGNGGGASDGSSVDVTNSGLIITHGELSDGIFAQSVGGGGGIGGNGAAGTDGLLPYPVEEIFSPVDQTSDSKLKNISIIVGGNAGSSGNGAAVTVTNSGAIFTTGANAMAIDAQSVGGGGGVGGVGNIGQGEIGPGGIGIDSTIGIGGKGGAGGNGGTVTITNRAALTTSGVAGYGIFAQSVGGGGGRAGDVSRGLAEYIGGQYAFGTGLAFGQGGGDGGDGKAVTVDNQGTVSTSGMGAIGIFAQSVGGGGGQLGNIGNGNVQGALGFFVGSVGDLGNGGAVSLIQSGDVSTMGSGATGIFAQSAGGQGTGDTVEIQLRGSITTMGADAVGAIAQSIGLNGSGNIIITDTGNILTSGDNSIGLLAQSLGAASVESIAGKPSITVTAIDTAGYVLPSLTGTARAGAISISQTGTTRTTGANAHGIVAQSISSQGAGGNIAITYDGSITASGMDADGIRAQSQGVAASPTDFTSPFPLLSATAVPNNGDIAITINGTGVVSGGGGGGAAIRFSDGRNNTLVNYGTLTTAKGLDGITVIGGSGNETFDNYGTLEGRINLGGGINAFHNHTGATIVPGAVLDMGSPAAVLDNAGNFSPGRAGTVLTTALNGSLNQTGSGVYTVDLDFLSLTADRINATGTIALGGKVTLNFDNVPRLRPGTTVLTIASADGGLTHPDLVLNAPQSAVAHYGLGYPNLRDAVLTLDVDYARAGTGMNANDAALGEYFNMLQTAGSSTSLAPTIQALFAIPDTQGLHDFYQTLSPEPFLNGQAQVRMEGGLLTDAMMSCHPARGDSFRFTDETECTWARVTPRMTAVDATADQMGFKSRAIGFALGHQFHLNENVVVGLAGGYSTGVTRTGSLADSRGDIYSGGLVLKVLKDPLELAFAVTGGQSVSHTSRFLTPTTIAASRQVDSYVNERARLSLQLFGDYYTYLRPFAEVNLNQLYTGAFQETGAGPLNLTVPGSQQISGTAGAGFELGTEFDLGGLALARPFLGYEFKDTILGRGQTVLASLEGAPTTVAPFAISTSSDLYLHQFTAGVDLLGNDNWNLRFLYGGSFGRTTRQDLYSLKVAIPL